MKNIKISIILTTYNRCASLPAVIKKVFEQSFADIELIICDDNSQDDTENVVRAFSDSRIVYHKSSENFGYAGNSLKGLELATGEFLLFIADDDEMGDNGFIAEAMEIFSKNPDCGSVFGRTAIKTPDEIIVNRFPFKSFYSSQEFLKELTGLRFTFQDYFSFSSFIFRTDIFRKTDPFRTVFSESGSVDISGIIKYLLITEKVAFADRVGYIWTRSAPDSLSGQKKDDMTYQTLQSVSAAIDIYNFFSDKEICKPVCNAYIKYIFNAILSDNRLLSRHKDFERVLKACKESVYIYGRGWTGLELKKYLEENGKKVIAFIDDFKTGHEDTISFRTFAERNEPADVIISMYKFEDVYKTFKRLSAIKDIRIHDLVSDDIKE